MQKQSGFSFQITKKNNGDAGRILAASLLFLGLFACFWNGLGLEKTGTSPLPLVAAGLVYCAAASKLSKWGLAFQVAATATLVLYAILVSRYIVSGWNVVMNAVFVLLEQCLGYIFPRYEVMATGLSPSMCAGLFLAMPVVLVGLLSAKAVCGRKLWFLPTGMILMSLFALIILNLYPPDWALVLLALGLAAVSVQRLTRETIRAAGAFSTAAHVLLFVMLLVACAIPALLWNGNGAAHAAQIRRTIEHKIHQFRYEDVEMTLPEGNFNNLKALVPGTNTALTITMDEPQKLYLRGYVGEIYTGSGWAGLEPEQKAKYSTLFSWLHERSFYGQMQYGLLCKALGEGGTGDTFTVTAKDVCTGWRYAPYGIINADADPRQIGDADLPAQGLHGEAEYTHLVGDVSINDYEQMAERLTAARKMGDPAAITYLTSENAYREFVYDSYLEIPDNMQKTISQVFAGLELPKEGRISFSDAQMVVRAYLSSIATYCEKPKVIPKDEDFAGSFLLDTREGYSVHYATAAALMFRYLGVPARYVEGWFIPEEIAAEMKPGNARELDQSFAHAWVEIYRDGVGFVPFEITPPYTAPMEQSSMMQGGSGGAAIPPEEEQDEPMTPRQIVLVSLLVLVLLLLLLFLITVFRRAFKRQKIHKLLEAENPIDAVSNMMTWAITLLECMDIRYPDGSLTGLLPQVEQMLGKEMALQFEKALGVQRLALFSRDGVNDDARTVPLVFVERLEAALEHYGTWAERQRFRWISCVI